MTILAIVGVTGAVGLEAIDILNNSVIHFDDLRLFASKSSVGKKINVKNKEYIVEEVKENSFDNIDYAILAVSSELAKQYVSRSQKRKSKCVFIDNSSAYRMDKSVPLIIPEINFDSYDNQKIISNPNCSTIIMLMILAPLHKNNNISRIDVSTYQAASGAGLEAMNELENQARAFANKTEMDTKVFGRQYLFNAFSHNSNIDMKTKFNEEEIKIINETYKILNVKDNKYFDFDLNFSFVNYYCILISVLLFNNKYNNILIIVSFLLYCVYLNLQKKNRMVINPTCVRIPTLRSHMESITVTFQNPTTENAIMKILEKSPGVKIYDYPEENRFPEPLVTEKKDDIYIGRIRQSYHGNPYVFQMLVSGDQIRKGAALNALQIYEKLIKK
jgi:aspartate-semialdehyde dehydrogenase